MCVFKLLPELLSVYLKLDATLKSIVLILISLYRKGFLAHDHHEEKMTTKPAGCPHSSSTSSHLFRFGGNPCWAAAPSTTGGGRCSQSIEVFVMRADGGCSDELHCASAIWRLTRLFCVDIDESHDCKPINEWMNLQVWSQRSTVRV